MVISMQPLKMLAGGTLMAGWLTVSAAAQTAPQLSYVQPISPTAVQAVQEHLVSAGAYSGAVDGVWGPDSVAALQRFQAGHQLQVTGQLNQATAATLGLDPAALLNTQQAALPAPTPPAQNLQPSSVRAVQAQLRRLGFYTGAIDGVWGQSTQNGIMRLQQSRGLQPNGQLEAATVSALGLSPYAMAYR